MKANDTVMTDKELINEYEAWLSPSEDENQIKGLREVANQQAKITWDKAIREVVEFIENNALRATYMADPSKECWGISDYELAKLKEWGIK